MPFPRFQALLARRSISLSVKRGAAPTTEHLARDVRVVSSYVPRATCLTQALAGRILLTHYGYPAIVHVGVTRAEGAGNTFHAHAWLESDGKVIIGESEVPYVPLTTLSETAGV
jgi:Transglutaminase-like superfamily